MRKQDLKEAATKVASVRKNIMHVSDAHILCWSSGEQIGQVGTPRAQNQFFKHVAFKNHEDGLQCEGVQNHGNKEIELFAGNWHAPMEFKDFHGDGHT